MRGLLCICVFVRAVQAVCNTCVWAIKPDVFADNLQPAAIQNLILYYGEYINIGLVFGVLFNVILLFISMVKFN